ncbi:CLUMA_CG004981, isoform B [Clunio marinus]|uniref:RB1-inducible coiled-coil protein 1 n=1 Tax=Clunio marinus TaxID=568069 RepID=A0A1J1HUT7_9DIPT|nr:CLUMA_CG004981, isoform B [Clunio marinus]
MESAMKSVLRSYLQKCGDGRGLEKFLRRNSFSSDERDNSTPIATLSKNKTKSLESLSESAKKRRSKSPKTSKENLKQDDIPKATPIPEAKPTKVVVKQSGEKKDKKHHQFNYESVIEITLPSAQPPVHSHSDNNSCIKNTTEERLEEPIKPIICSNLKPKIPSQQNIETSPMSIHESCVSNKQNPMEWDSFIPGYDSAAQQSFQLCNPMELGDGEINALKAYFQQIGLQLPNENLVVVIKNRSTETQEDKTFNDIKKTKKKWENIYEKYKEKYRNQSNFEFQLPEAQSTPKLQVSSQVSSKINEKSSQTSLVKNFAKSTQVESTKKDPKKCQETINNESEEVYQIHSEVADSFEFVAGSMRKPEPKNFSEESSTKSAHSKIESSDPPSKSTEPSSKNSKHSIQPEDISNFDDSLKIAIALLNSLLESKRMKPELKRNLAGKVINKIVQIQTSRSMQTSSLGSSGIYPLSNSSQPPSEALKLAKKLPKKNEMSEKETSKQSREEVFKDCLKSMTQSELNYKHSHYDEPTRGSTNKTSAPKSELMNYVKKEKESHLKWIEKEIEHLKNLRDLLNQNETPIAMDENCPIYENLSLLLEKQKKSKAAENKCEVESDTALWNSHANLKKMKNRSKLGTPTDQHAAPSNGESLTSFIANKNRKFIERYENCQKVYEEMKHYTQPYHGGSRRTKSIKLKSEANKKTPITITKYAQTSTSLASSSVFESSDSMSLPVNNTNSNNKTTTTHYQSDMFTNKVNKKNCKNVKIYSKIAETQTTNSIFRTKPIYEARKKSDDDNKFATTSTNVTQRINRMKNDKQLQTHPPSIKYTLSFDKRSRANIRENVPLPQKTSKNIYNENYSVALESRHSEDKENYNTDTLIDDDDEIDLQTCLNRKRPEIFMRFEERKKCIEELKKLRALRNEHRRKLLLLTSEKSLETKLLSSLPEPPLKTKRIFSTKALKLQTQKKFNNLTEVQQKKKDENLKNLKRKNRLMTDIFNKKTVRVWNQASVFKNLTKMLYIFNMDQGRMLTFEMSLALDTVQSLMLAVERQYAIPASSQVLLVSGGETLKPSSRVCTYSAGTDSNPIFMFSSDLEQRNPPAPWPSIENDSELDMEVKRCLELRAEYKTIVIRAQLAQTYYDLGKKEFKVCDKLVHEQHLQHQGWMAVIANLEDLTTEFQSRCNDFDKVFRDHIERRMEYKNYLESFDEDIEKLSKIPILPPLIQGAENQPFHAFDEVYNDDESFADNLADEFKKEISAVEESPQQSTSLSQEDEGLIMKDSNQKLTSSLTLLQWISSSENQKSLKRMAENCTRELEVFDKNVMDTLKDEIERTFESASREDMKEIKGLEERLRGLESLMFEARKIVQEQNDLAQAFQQNQARAANLGDQSILPDLCASHRNQLIVMQKNHKRMYDIRVRCSKAKDELAKNLFQRLKFVIHIENRMYEIDSKLLFYHTCLRRLQKHLGIIEQIHQAPCVYVQAVTEVVRRRIFSSAFLMWASNLACHLLTIYNDEVMRRQEFKYSFDGHFLNTLFPGIEDFPPKFATEAPSMFDSSLPDLTKNDLADLSNYLPELTKANQLPNLSAIIDFFSSRSSHSNQEMTSIDESGNPTNKKLLNVFAQIKDYEKGCESETDTEEYEKIGQTSTDKNKLNLNSICVGTNVETCDMSTSMDVRLTKDEEVITDDNVAVGLEVDRLKKLLGLMHQAAQESINLLRHEISTIKFETTNEKENIQKELTDLLHSWEDLKVEAQNHEREIVQRLTVDHELEMNDLRQSLYIKDDEINTLKSEKKELEKKIDEQEMKFKTENSVHEKKTQELEQKRQELEKKLSQQSVERDAALKELRERMLTDHRNEIESLRCKFKLMTSMERSPSDTSLEKIERPDIIDISSHEAIVNQMKENFEEELKVTVKAAIEKERSESTRKVSVTSSPGKSPIESQEIFRRILDEKDRQLDQMREREQFLMKESMRLKETIQSLTDIELNESQLSIYKEKLEDAQNEKKKLEKDLEKERSKRAKLSALSQCSGGVTVNSCSKDDLVLVVWNSAHDQYTVVQDSSILYFLHAESFNDMKLVSVPPNTYPKVNFCIGKVTDKEYCHAKKDENRYKVSKGTKFYRVKVRPRSPLMDKSTTIEKKRSRKSTDSQSESSKSSKIERQPSILIDSFSQTDTKNLLLDTATGGVASSDMVDSGVDSQHKGIFKERNISLTEDDECLSFNEDRFRDKTLIMSEEEDEADKQAKADDKKEDSEEAPVMRDQAAIEGELASLDDSDEYRSLEGRDEDTEL